VLSSGAQATLARGHAAVASQVALRPPDVICQTQTPAAPGADATAAGGPGGRTFEVPKRLKPHPMPLRASEEDGETAESANDGTTPL
jgi:hypothetical protein